MRRPAIAFLADLAVLIVFVLVGRAEHDSGSEFVGYLATLAPFALALTLAWAATPTIRRKPFAARIGATVWAVTLVGGMALRRLVFGDGIALAFIIVAAAFTALGIIGWRAVTERITARP